MSRYCPLQTYSSDNPLSRWGSLGKNSLDVAKNGFVKAILECHFVRMEGAVRCNFWSLAKLFLKRRNIQQDDLQSSRSKLTILNWGYFFTRSITTCDALLVRNVWTGLYDRADSFSCSGWSLTWIQLLLSLKCFWACNRRRSCLDKFWNCFGKVRFLYSQREAMEIPISEHTYNCWSYGHCKWAASTVFVVTHAVW